jgi:chorismate mutase
VNIFKNGKKEQSPPFYTVKENGTKKTMIPNDVLKLDRIAARLEGLEETIIYKLIDRAQFAENAVIYEPGKSGFKGSGDLSLFDLRLRRQEEMDSDFGRFCVPEERPFNRDLPDAKRNVAFPATGLEIDDFDTVNVTADILKAYTGLLKDICLAGDDGHYGSATEHDVYALQAIARRVHYGALYVSESKYQSDPLSYDKLIATKDLDSLMQKLTRADVEEKILARIAQKVDHIQSGINSETRRSVPPDAIMTFYRNHVIPLTKEGEIRYFLNRRR